jgi:hypothetical protein
MSEHVLTQLGLVVARMHPIRDFLWPPFRALVRPQYTSDLKYKRTRTEIYGTTALLVWDNKVSLSVAEKWPGVVALHTPLFLTTAEEMQK